MHLQGLFCRGGGIRTPGTSRYNGFQDRRDRPLCHSSISGRLVIEFAKIGGLTSYANIFPSFYRKYLIFLTLNFRRARLGCSTAKFTSTKGTWSQSKKKAQLPEGLSSIFFKLSRCRCFSSARSKLTFTA